MIRPLTLLAASLLGASSVPAAFDPLEALAAYDVTWDSPSADGNGTMPIGNGEIGLNVWGETNGDLRILIARTDAWDELGRLVKVGQVRIRLTPSPVAEGRPFRQTLRLQDGLIRFDLGGRATAELWADAHRPLMHVAIESREDLAATAMIERWRKERVEVDYTAKGYHSDPPFMRSRPDAQAFVGPDVLLPDGFGPGAASRIGWYHDNGATDWYEKTAKFQGLEGFPGRDPLEGRIFGAVVEAAGAKRKGPDALHSPAGRRHRFDLAVVTRQPTTAGQWIADACRELDTAAAVPYARRREAHAQWWNDFWRRSWIFVTSSGETADSGPTFPTNAHPVAVGVDQAGQNRFAGAFGRVSLFDRALGADEVARLAASAPDAPMPEGLKAVAIRAGSGRLVDPGALEPLRQLTLEAWVKPEPQTQGGGRLVDCITPGDGDGFLLDTHPGNSLRLIAGRRTLALRDALPPGRWTHVAATLAGPEGAWTVYRDGRALSAEGATDEEPARTVTQGYVLQRWITACAGRGALPIKFNGSLFTVPVGGTGSAFWDDNPDYRRWGSGYWWQNTRLPYIGACTAGDFDLLPPLFRMYAGDTLDVARYRNRHHLKTPGAFLNECSYFWGHAFNECYGADRPADLPPGINLSQWHRWEFTCGYELIWMMLDYYDHTRDEAYLKGTLLPFAQEILTFYDARYPTDAAGTIVIQPGQALETWWNCTNPMPDIAGLTAVTDRLLDLAKPQMTADQAALVARLRAKMPPLPVREVQGKRMLAPAGTFADKRNIENPELYAVFPFRLVAVGKPGLDLGLAALEHRPDRGRAGWRQDGIFMAYLGLADAARDDLTARARSRHRESRFPAFWGPNYDWVPDQDHGGVLMRNLQAMLLQTDGRAIRLLPAWPRNWNADFRLHAPDRTVVEGRVQAGRLTACTVTPRERKADLVPRP